MTLHFRVRAPLFAAGLIATLAGLGIANADERLETAYAVTLFGLPIGHISWTIDVQKNRFTAAASGATAGLLRIFAQGKGNSSASGVVTGDVPAPSAYALSIVDAGNWSDEVQIRFGGGKAREHLGPSPTQPAPNRVPLTQAHRKGVLDPMTALLIPVAGTGETVTAEACNRTLAVFDGHMRYDLRLTFKRRDKVKSDEGYQGAVVVCAVYFSPLAGHDPDRFGIRYLAEQRDMEIWLAPIAGTRLVVPYRVSIPTPMGRGVLQATRFVALPEPAPSGATTAH